MKIFNIKAGTVIGLLAVSLPLTYAQSFITNGLVAYYPFNGNPNDAVGTNNGTIYGGVALAPDRFEAPNSAYTFNGIDGYIDVGSPAGNSPVYLTETAWVKILSRETAAEPISPPEDVLITQRQTPGSGSGWPDLGVISGGSSAGAGAVSLNTDFYYNGCIGTTFTPTNTWFFICGVVSNGTYQIYINGSLENTIFDSHPLNSPEHLYLMHSGAFDKYCHGMLDDVRIYNRALSTNEVAQLYSFESGFCSPHAAEATAIVTNGFVVGATITDFGCGYTNAPEVLIQGGGGSGATATATIQNGFVTGINVINAGSAYTNLPDVLIGSPPFVPTLSINVSRVAVTMHVVLGLNYVLESSSDMINWTATGPQFTAQSETITEEFVINQTGQFFRILQVP